MGRASRLNPTAQAYREGHVQQTKAYDRFGRELASGSGFYWTGKVDTVWEMVEVKPIMHPGAPAGLVEIHVMASVRLAVPGGKPLLDIFRVLTPEQAKALQDGRPLEDEPPPADASVADPPTPDGKPLIVAP
jgi:hypothetical protein